MCCVLHFLKAHFHRLSLCSSITLLTIILIWNRHQCERSWQMQCDERSLSFMTGNATHMHRYMAVLKTG
jgi:hypothetical protein